MEVIKKNTEIFFWGFVWICIMGTIFAFSTLPGSPVYYEPPFWLVLQRKGAHVVEYAALTVVSFQFFRLLFVRDTVNKVLVIAASWAIMYGVTDELHQYFTPFRGAYMRDVGIDMIGVLLGVVGVLVYQRYKKNK